MVGISDNDFRNKVKTILAFLEKSHPVKLWIQVKRRRRSANSQNDLELLFKSVMTHIKEHGTEKDVVYSTRGLSCLIKSKGIMKQ